MVKEIKKNKNYLNNRDMLEQYKLSKAQGKMTEEFGKMMMLLVHRYLNHPKFYRYTENYKMEMESNALVTLCRVWGSFDETKSQNPFAYFTTICTNAFIQVLNQERKNRDIRDELRVYSGFNASYGYQERYGEDDEDSSESYDRMHESETQDEWGDDNVYDVTDEYMAEAFGSEPVGEEPVAVEDEEEDDNSQELINAYLATVTPTPTTTPKKRGAKPKPKPTPLPKPPKVRPVKESNGVTSVRGGTAWQCRLTKDGIKIASLSYHTEEEAIQFYKDYLEELKKGTPVNQIQDILRSSPVHNYKLRKVESQPKIDIQFKQDKQPTYIVERSNGTYHFRILKDGYKLYSPAYTDRKLAEQYRDECLALMKEGVSQDEINKRMLENPMFNSRNDLLMHRMKKRFTDMTHIVKCGRYYRVVINNRFFKVDKQFKTIEDAKEYRNEILKGAD